MDISCIVLVGGKSTRLGRNKIKEIIGNQSLLERVISRLACFKSEIIVVTARAPSLPQPIDYPKLKVVSDIYPDKGSLGGIYTGLRVSDSFHSLVVAGDMPFLNRDLLEYMIENSNGFDVIVPRLDGIFEPLHAIYSKNCIAPMESLIKQDDLQILKLFPFVKMRYIEREEIDRYDPRHLSFFNINTEADLRAGAELAKREDVDDKC
ncbi:MAG: molybdenum cofactor guanylyltransferase [Dehalococcoidia bacterium]|nr:molybdenum cofactor guanylyltransferase [Dehalococcoidia bacterium]